MEIVLVMGYPASGKSSWALANFPKHRRINRDSLGDKTLDDLVPLAAAALDEGAPVVLDTSIEDAQYNAAERMVRKYGSLPSPAEIKKLSRKDPNTFGRQRAPPPRPT